MRSALSYWPPPPPATLRRRPPRADTGPSSSFYLTLYLSPKEREQREPEGTQNDTATGKTVWKCLTKLNRHRPHEPAIALLGTDSTGRKPMGTHRPARKGLQPLCVITPKGRQPDALPSTRALAERRLNHRVLVCNKKERVTDSRCNVDESQRHFARFNPDSKGYNIYDPIYVTSGRAKL